MKSQELYDQLISLFGETKQKDAALIAVIQLFARCSKKKVKFENEEEKELIKTIFEQIRDSISFWLTDDSTIYKFKYLKINFNWKMSPLHKNNSVSNYAKKIDEGNFSSEERKLIMKRWNEFCKIYDFDPKKPQIFLPNPFFLRRRFPITDVVRFIGQDFPHRSLSSLYHQFQNCLKCKRGRFQPKENLLLLQMKKVTNLFGMQNLHLSLSSLILDRPKYHIYRRYKLVLSTEYEEKSINICKKKSKTKENVPQSENGINENPISVKLRNKLISKWLMTVKPNLLQKKLNKYVVIKDLINKLNSDEYEDWDDISWIYLGKKMKVGHVLLFFLLNQFVKQFVPCENQRDFKACIHFLSNNCLPKLMKKIQARDT